MTNDYENGKRLGYADGFDAGYKEGQKGMMPTRLLLPIGLIILGLCLRILSLSIH